MNTVGFVGTVEVETRSVSRLWFSLTEDQSKDNWIRLGQVRAWFTMNLEAGDRPFYLAQMTIVMEAMRAALQINVSHGGAADFEKQAPNDSFEVDGVRVLRSPMRF
jgi:hypothetical protein